MTIIITITTTITITITITETLAACFGIVELSLGFLIDESDDGTRLLHCCYTLVTPL
jgi:hypothetical protein